MEKCYRHQPENFSPAFFVCPPTEAMTPGDAPMQTTVAANESPAKPPSFPTARNLHMTTNMSTKLRRKHLAQQDAGHACMCPLPVYGRHGTHLRNLNYNRSKIQAACMEPRPEPSGEKGTGSGPQRPRRC